MQHTRLCKIKTLSFRAVAETVVDICRKDRSKRTTPFLKKNGDAARKVRQARIYLYVWKPIGDILLN